VSVFQLLEYVAEGIPTFDMHDVSDWLCGANGAAKHPDYPPKA
jgi:hypothetical protein